MLYRHVFDKISTEFRGILRVFVNFAALRRREISEALTMSCVIYIYKLATENLHLATIFLQLVAKRRPDDFFNLEPCQGGIRLVPRTCFSPQSRRGGSFDLVSRKENIASRG